MLNPITLNGVSPVDSTPRHFPIYSPFISLFILFLCCVHVLCLICHGLWSPFRSFSVPSPFLISCRLRVPLPTRPVLYSRSYHHSLCNDFLCCAHECNAPVFGVQN